MDTSKRNCIIVHGCPSRKESAINVEDRTYDKHWIPWIREELIARGVPTETPLIPEPWQPAYERFKEKFEQYHVDEHTILIGHSCGCAFLVRWLGESKQKIARLILVAPWKVPKPGDASREAYYNFAIDATIKERVGRIVMFTSDNEKVDGKKSLQIYREELGGEVIGLKGRGHFTTDDMGTTLFPELLDAIFANDGT